MRRFLSLLWPYRLRLKILLTVIAHFMCLSAWAQLPTAPQVASQMKVGWNLGNTLEAICGENAWGNPNATQSLINSVKAAGFNTVRIPVAWDCHTTNGVIDPNWLARVKTVVDYCINNNMYVIINIHWDGGWLDSHINSQDQASVNAKQKNYWTQIANYFKNYNERLLFAGANEPPADDATKMSILLSYHQTFINAVRATGGNNSSRTLIVQGPGTDIVNTNNLMNTMPTDQIANRLMVEVHYYTPWGFCGQTKDETWGSMFYYWGNGFHSTIETSRNATWGEESEAERLLGLMKTKFVDKGYPVLIGEFGAIKRDNPADMAKHVASREYFNKYLVTSAKNKGMIPVYWDNGAPDFGIFNRNTGAVSDQGVVNAIMQGAGGTTTTTYRTIKNRATGLLIDGMYRTSNGSNAGQYAASGSDAQQWILETAGSYVKLKNRVTGLYLDGMGRTSNGSLVGQWSASGVNQEWTLETVGSYSKLKNRATGLYLDGMGWTANGSDLGQWANSTSNNQQWTITNVSSSGRIASSNIEEELIVEEPGSEISLSPNPFTSGIKISIRDPKVIKNIIMIDLAGKEVEVIEHENIKTEQIIGAHLKSGLYVVQIDGLKGRQTFKVMKK
jgi:endoglucanase